VRLPRQAGIVVVLHAWALAAAAQMAPAPQPLRPAEQIEWRTGLIEINENWLTHSGDSLAWANPSFDDGSWQTVDIEDLGRAEPGWRWFRRHVSTGPDHPEVRLLVEGGNGAYELYVNGQIVPGTQIRSAFNVTRPAERVFEVSNDSGDFAIAIRTHVPISYSAYHLPLFLSITMGGPTAIGYEREAAESERLYSVAPSIAINLLLILSGIALFFLFWYQKSHREYLFLGLYLLFSGLSNCMVVCQEAGLLPTSANILFADPLIYLFSIAQIEFTFAFASRPISRPWRIYEILLLAQLVLLPFCWTGILSYDWYLIEEQVITLPIPLLLPVLLLAWWRRGNREAAWLILPSMLPAGLGISYTLGSISIFMSLGRFDFLANPIQIGPYPFAVFDIGTLLFLLAIGFVMFFRFTRVSREQARSAAELDAAREIQRRLVPACLPDLKGWRIQAAYLPAQEVGGDFYQVLQLTNGAAWVVVGDVSGKGLKAAMTGTLAIGALRALAPDASGPAELLSRLNNRLADSQDGGFITCLCALIRPDGTLTLANAGHLAPYRNGEEVPVDGGLPLGIVANVAYTETTIAVAPGDSLTLLSDGVVEARNPAGELFGFERTREASGQPAQAIAASAQAFGQEDDITVLTLTRLAPA
jgi:preprotein translocase subunit YajC